jgi:hypothetical protein
LATQLSVHRTLDKNSNEKHVANHTVKNGYKSAFSSDKFIRLDASGLIDEAELKFLSSYISSKREKNATVPRIVLVEPVPFSSTTVSSVLIGMAVNISALHTILSFFRMDRLKMIDFPPPLFQMEVEDSIQKESSEEGYGTDF